jgi:hypothetical protein
MPRLRLSAAVTHKSASVPQQLVWREDDPRVRRTVARYGHVTTLNPVSLTRKDRLYLRQRL